MTVPVRIEAYTSRLFTEKRERPPQARWLNAYYQALLAPYSLTADPALLENATNNVFLDMGSRVIRDLSQRCETKDVGLLVMAHQTLDTYFPFQATTTMLCREFGIESPAVSLTEQERSSPYIGLTLALAALKKGKSCGSALLLALDQSTLPYRSPQIPADAIDCAIAMKLTAVADGSGTVIEGAHYWTEGARAKPQWLMQRIYAFLDASRIEIANLDLVADEELIGLFEGKTSMPRLHKVDARLMSCGGLIAITQLLNNGAKSVLSVHLAADDHLYLFLFRTAP